MMERVSISSGVLGVVDQGVGTPMLLVHAFPLDHSMWRAQIDTFCRSRRVIAPDLRGFGTSEVTSGVVTMEQLADDLAEVLSALDVSQPVTLCGLSMGGYVAWQFWQRHHERLGRLILCDTRAAADTPVAAKARQIMALEVLRDGSRVAAEAMIPKLFAESTYEQRAELVEATRDVILATSPEAIAAAQRGMAQRPEMTERLGEVNTPALLICGEADSISPPSEMQSIAAAMPKAEFVTIADAGHLAPLEQPQAVNDAIEQFLGN